MIIWRGFGWIVPILWFLPFVAAASLNDVDRKLSVLLTGVSFAAVGVLQVFVGRRLNRRQIWDHTLFFIPVQAWGLVSIGFGLFLIATRLSPFLWAEFIG